ncbi:hypothetical protein, partial [Rhodococcus qingshengii]|uniref:hypothetical protein n=1 Tax=Rhodococcus qingshengii TaxID=334542 RepID=UPI002AFF8034
NGPDVPPVMDSEDTGAIGALVSDRFNALTSQVGCHRHETAPQTRTQRKSRAQFGNSIVIDNETEG